MAELVNVEMPDGTIIEGVPEGTSKAELQAKLSKYKAPGSEALPPLSEMAKDVWKGATTPSIANALLPGGGGAMQAAGKHLFNAYDRLAYNAGGKVTDWASPHMSPESAAKFGYGTNVAVQALPVLLGSLLGKAASPALEEGSKSLMQSALKPSVTDLKSGDADRAIGTMLEKGINPTRGGMSKAATMAEKLNETGSKALSPSTAQADIPSVIQRLDPLKTRATLQVNPEADIAAIEKAISEFKNSPAISNAGSIPVQLAQKLKSGTYTSIGNKAYGELGSASTEAQKQLARGLREEIIAKVPELAEPLKQEAALRNVMEVAANRALMDSNKNPLSLGTSAGALMHDPLAAAGMWANASTPIKAMLARMLYSGRGVIPTTAGAAAGAVAGNRSGRSEE